MPTLGELLAGILKDLAQSRFAADALTRDHVALYQGDPILGQIPVPRMVVKDVTLRLRFAVEAHDLGRAPEPEDVVLDRAWRGELAARVLPRLLGTLLGAETGPERLAELAARVAQAAARSRFGLDEALAGRPDRAVTVSVDRIVAGLGALPEALRKTLPPAPALRRQTEQHVRDRLTDALPRLRQAAAARRAALMDLSVLVRPADLTQVQESAIQEITLTLSMDDVKLADPRTLADAGPEE